MSIAEKLLLNMIRKEVTYKPVDVVYCTNVVQLNYSSPKGMFYVSVNGKSEELSGERLIQLININELRPL
ncbi:hypothetical protein_gp154 [Bacillus phage vB_BceM_WH1]|nr:hypothetical protein_gp154 [Bacillus phage vB_BceM_WH1]